MIIELYNIYGIFLGILNLYKKKKKVLDNINLKLEKMTEDNIKIKGKIESIDIERTIDD